MNADELERRRAADEWIARRLKEIDYTLAHLEAQQLADHLQNLGVGTLVELNKAGSLLRACQKLTHGALPPLPKSWTSESHRVIVTTVRIATPRFITESMRTWSSSQSSIATYFINFCLIQFKSVYLQYCKEEGLNKGYGFAERERPEGNLINLFDTRMAGDDPADLCIAWATVREIVSFIGSAEFAKYAWLCVTGKDLSRDEVARKLGISPRTLDRRRAEWREKLGSRGWGPRAQRGEEEDRGE